MKHKYIGITLLVAMQVINMQALAVKQPPKLVVSIAIEQLRTDYLEKFAHLYGEYGFKQLLEKGTVYTSAQIPFHPVDRASAIASISTGTSPYYNSIVGIEWLNRNTLKPTYCISNEQYDCYSPANIATSTIGDELKIATNGNAIVYGIAGNQMQRYYLPDMRQTVHTGLITTIFGARRNIITRNCRNGWIHIIKHTILQ